jgi:hypothetical protein
VRHHANSPMQSRTVSPNGRIQLSMNHVSMNHANN